MKGEETRQRRKESKTRNGERSRHKAKSKSKQRESKLGSLGTEDGPLLLPPKQPAEAKVAMAKLVEESSLAIGLQVLLPYMLAGLGMVLAGMVLDYVQVRRAGRMACAFVSVARSHLLWHGGHVPPVLIGVILCYRCVGGAIAQW